MPGAGDNCAISLCTGKRSMSGPGNSVLHSSDGAFMQQGVSILIASTDGAERPCVCRASGCRLREDGRVLVFLAAARGRRVLDAVGVSSTVAVVISEPPTHRTIQIKGTDATVVAAADSGAVIDEYADRFAATLTALGYSDRMARELVGVEPEQARAVLFTPTAVFDQTPGPGAGAAVAVAK